MKKLKTVTAKLISAFVFATQIVQFLYFLSPKFPASSHFCGCIAWFVSDLVRNQIVGVCRGIPILVFLIQIIGYGHSLKLHCQASKVKKCASFGRNGVKCAVLEVKWALFVAKFYRY